MEKRFRSFAYIIKCSLIRRVRFVHNDGVPASPFANLVIR